jgi:hypothetical protein
VPRIKNTATRTSSATPAASSRSWKRAADAHGQGTLDTFGEFDFDDASSGR